MSVNERTTHDRKKSFWSLEAETYSGVSLKEASSGSQRTEQNGSTVNTVNPTLTWD